MSDHAPPALGSSGRTDRPILGRLARRGARRVLDTFPDVELLRTALEVRRRTGKSLVDQGREIAELRRGFGRLSAHDYFAFELFDDTRFTAEQKRRYIGWSSYALGSVANESAVARTVSDKLTMYTMLRGLGIPHPPLLAVYMPGSRSAGAIPTLRDPQELESFIVSSLPATFFGKPLWDFRGQGASLVRDVDRERRTVRMSDGEVMGVDAYVRRWAVEQTRPAVRFGNRPRPQHSLGYLFQTLLEQHPDIDEVSGGRVCTLRMVILVGRDGPTLHRAKWKLPTGNNITDAAIKASANMHFLVNPERGEVLQGVRWRGPEPLRYPGLGAKGTPMDVHPDTGARLRGLRLPRWKEVVAGCLDAARCFPQIRYQSWDVGIGRDGPLFVELNTSGGIQQVLHGEGCADETFMQWLREIAGEHPDIRRLAGR